MLNRQHATAKDSVVGSCMINHRTISDDMDYSNRSAQILAINIISKGCGTGEYRGVYNRTNGTECICGARYYKPPIEDCKACPSKGLVCDSIGIKTPAVARDYWRYDPTSPDFLRYPIYKCVIPQSSPHQDVTFVSSETFSKIPPHTRECPYI